MLVPQYPQGVWAFRHYPFIKYKGPPFLKALELPTLHSTAMKSVRHDFRTEIETREKCYLLFGLVGALFSAELRVTGC